MIGFNNTVQIVICNLFRFQFEADLNAGVPLLHSTHQIGTDKMNQAITRLRYLDLNFNSLGKLLNGRH